MLKCKVQNTSAKIKSEFLAMSISCVIKTLVKICYLNRQNVASHGKVEREILELKYLRDCSWRKLAVTDGQTHRQTPEYKYSIFYGCSMTKNNRLF